MSQRPFIVPVFIPHAGCPHRCVFCNQSAVTGCAQPLPTPAELRERVAAFLKFRGRRRRGSQIAFFGGNFLGVAPETIKSLLAEATGFVRTGAVEGIRFSTRPDTVTARTLTLIEPFPVHTVELGVQSMAPVVLARSQRGHTPEITVEATRRLKERGYAVGHQLMVGLPGDNEECLLATGRSVIGLKPDFIRIYPTLVLPGSLLENWHRRGLYAPLTLEAAVGLTLKLYRLFRTHAIPVIRMGLQAAEGLPPEGADGVGPHHPAFGHLVMCAAFRDAVRGALDSFRPAGPSLRLHVHPQSISRMRGLHNATIGELQERFGFEQVEVCPEPALAPDDVGVGGIGRVVSTITGLS